MPYDQTRECRGPAIPTDEPYNGDPRYAPGPCHNCRACALDHAADIGLHRQLETAAAHGGDQ